MKAAPTQNFSDAIAQASREAERPVTSALPNDLARRVNGGVG